MKFWGRSRQVRADICDTNSAAPLHIMPECSLIHVMLLRIFLSVAKRSLCHFTWYQCDLILVPLDHFSTARAFGVIQVLQVGIYHRASLVSLRAISRIQSLDIIKHEKCNEMTLNSCGLRQKSTSASLCSFSVRSKEEIHCQRIPPNSLKFQS